MCVFRILSFLANKIRFFNSFYWIVCLLLIYKPVKAQLTPIQESNVKRTTESFFRNIERLASDHLDGDAMDSLVQLFGDAVNKEVHNDLKPGNSMVSFLDYLTLVRLSQGTLKFSYNEPKYFYMMNYGHKFGVVQVEKSISGGYQQSRTINSVLIINAITGKIGEIVSKTPKEALPLSPPTQHLVINNQRKSRKIQEPKEVEVPEIRKEEVEKEDTDLPLIEMIFVKGGEFTMGNNDGLQDEIPEHKVVLSDFFIGRYEVTQKQWEMIMGDNPSKFRSKNCPDCPVERVSWYDVQKFITKLRELTGGKYRLPTEAEWEYAAKGGDKSLNYNFAGSDTLQKVAWFTKNSEEKGSGHPFYGTNPVGKRLPNELGIHDMNGNVWEWCNDWYDDMEYSTTIMENPTGPSKREKKVLRGGSWGNEPEAFRLTLRGKDKPDYKSRYLGFRLCMSIN